MMRTTPNNIIITLIIISSNSTQADLQPSLGDDVDGENELHYHCHHHDVDDNGQGPPPFFRQFPKEKKISNGRSALTPLSSTSLRSVSISAAEALQPT